MKEDTDMNNEFVSPECEVMIFENEDVITVSVGMGDQTNLPELNSLAD